MPLSNKVLVFYWIFSSLAFLKVFSSVIYEPHVFKVICGAVMELSFLIIYDDSESVL